MGAMTIMAMAAQRDNYFAALLPMSCKWGNNFNKNYPFNLMALPITMPLPMGISSGKPIVMVIRSTTTTGSI